FGDFRMAVEECIHVRELTVVDILIAAHATILAAIETLLLTHEGIGILAKFLADSRSLLQKPLQIRIVLQELFVVDERRVLLKLFGDLRVVVEEIVQVSEFAAGYVAVAVVRRAVFLPVKTLF